MGRWTSLTSLRSTLADLVLPTPCAGCGADSVVPVCPDCLAGLGCPRLVPPQPVHPPGLPPVRCLADWDGAARNLVLAHKERGRTELATVLGRVLAPAVAAAGPGPLLLVPIPSRPGVRRSRGHDPVARTAIAGAAALRAQGRTAQALPLLRHARAVRDQAGLGSAQRARNLAGALVARRGAGVAMPGASVVLIDDVLTTGATLSEAARALREAGIPVLAGAVVAAVLKRA